MSQGRNFILSASIAVALAGCVSTPAPGPVEVTRFHDASALDTLGRGTIFVQEAPGSEEAGLELAPYKAAIAAELTRLGYAESTRSNARSIAQVDVERYAIGIDGDRRGPVSVGVGGSTGSYGSGVGVGIGINLGGNQNRERVGTELSVMIRDVQTNQAVWEGRARFEPARGSEEAQVSTNASIIADALFREFPGGNGETIEVEVP